jgi:hypothetical protein
MDSPCWLGLELVRWLCVVYWLWTLVCALDLVDRFNFR